MINERETEIESAKKQLKIHENWNEYDVCCDDMENNMLVIYSTMLPYVPMAIKSTTTKIFFCSFFRVFLHFRKFISILNAFDVLIFVWLCAVYMCIFNGPLQMQISHVTGKIAIAIHYDGKKIHSFLSTIYKSLHRFPSSKEILCATSTTTIRCTTFNSIFMRSNKAICCLVLFWRSTSYFFHSLTLLVNWLTLLILNSDGMWFRWWSDVLCNFHLGKM